MICQKTSVLEGVRSQISKAITIRISNGVGVTNQKIFHGGRGMDIGLTSVTSHFSHNEISSRSYWDLNFSTDV